MGTDFGKQDLTGEQFVILAPIGKNEITEIIFFRGKESEAIKRAEVYAPNGNYKIKRDRADE